MADKWIKCIAKGGNVLATTITAADLIEDARRRHKLGRAQTVALGEALMAGLLLASTAKTGERVSLSIKGDKTLRQAIVDANPHGTVRGFVISSDTAGEIDETRGPWQTGLLSVVRLKLEEKEPYVGTVPTVTGHLAKDLTFYLSQSEQIPSSVGLAVNLNDDGGVGSAGAFLIQIMPGASSREIKLVEDNLNELSSLAATVRHDSDPTRLLGHLFNDMIFTILEERILTFECNCSKDRVMRALKLVGKDELSDMIAKDGGASVHCDFCGTHYNFSVAELAAVIRELT